MKKRSMVAAALAFLCMGPAIKSTKAQHDHVDHGHGSAAKLAPLPHCPVMDEPVNLTVSLATETGPVYFCCPGCIATYKKAPSKYEAKVVAQRLALAKRPKVQVTCPVTKEPVDGKTSIEVNGKTIQFCCKGCAQKYQGNPGKYAAALLNSYSYQTICPVMGEPINPTVFSKLPTGETIYYCCKGCDKPLRKDPVKYNQSLVKQGIAINWAAVKSADAKKEHDHSGHGHHKHDHDDGHDD